MGEQREEADEFSPVTQMLLARMAKEIVCEVFGLSMAELNSPMRGTVDTALARQSAMYLAHIVGQLTLNELADVFERDRSTVSHACNNVEDRRDSALFDIQLEYMEKRLRQRIKSGEAYGLFKGEPVLERKSVSLAG